RVRRLLAIPGHDAAAASVRPPLDRKAAATAATPRRAGHARVSAGLTGIVDVPIAGPAGCPKDDAIAAGTAVEMLVVVAAVRATAVAAVGPEANAAAAAACAVISRPVPFGAGVAARAAHAAAATAECWHGGNVVGGIVVVVALRQSGAAIAAGGRVVREVNVVDGDVAAAGAR